MSTTHSAKTRPFKRTATATATPVAPAPLKLPPIRRGLTIVSCPDATKLRLIREVFTNAALSASADLPVRMPRVPSVTSMFVGSRRNLDLVKVSLAALKQSGRGKKFDHRYVISAEPIEWTSPGGLSLAEQAIQETDGWLILEQPVGGASLPTNVEGMFRIRQAALRRKIRVLLIVPCPHHHDAETLPRVADEYFEIGTCEPDPGWDDALVIDCTALSRGNGLAIGRVVCNAKLVDGKYVTSLSPFVSPSAKTRFMAILLSQGKTLRQIGKLVHLDKSGVSRHLQGVPSVPKRALSDDELRLWQQACGIDPVHADSDADPPDDVEDVQDAGGEGDHRDAKSVVRAKEKRRNKRNERNKRKLKA